MYRLQQPLLVDERNQDDGLPVVLLAVQIRAELRRVEVGDRRLRIAHQIL